MSTKLPFSSSKVVIIGGGAIGLSVAYHLGKLGWTDVILLERNELTSGTSWHAAGIVGPLRANMNMTKLAVYATELFTSLEAETGQATGYRQTGGLWLAQTPERLIELRRIAAMGDLNGLGVNVISAAEVKVSFPLLNIDDISGALWVDEDGQTNPVDTCLAFARGAKQSGVHIKEHTAVTAINKKNNAVFSVITHQGEEIRCDYVVNCAGLWARQIGELAGCSVPLQAVEHMYIVTDTIDELPKPCPIVRDLDSRIYLKEDTGKLVLGGFEANAKLWQPSEDGAEGGYINFPQDWDQFEPFLEAGLHRVPVLENTGIQHFMNGPESFTPDTRQLMGESPDVKNYFIAAGFNSIGIMSSAGVGKALAEWLIDGDAPMDLWSVDVARADPLWNQKHFLRSRTQEAVAAQFEMHWPYKQMKTGRDLRRSVWHDRFAAAGAVFGAPTGWERPLWFAHNEAEKEISYSYGQQTWWPYAEREAKAMQKSAALFELSPFTKLQITGTDAGTLLQRLCPSDMRIATGKLVYTLMLNQRGGIEADVTVCRISDDEYWLISGAATRWKDVAWINRNLISGENVVISDVTEQYAVLGLMGPNARGILQNVCDQDCSNQAFPFGVSRYISINGNEVRVQRVSFVGELGYEIYIPIDSALVCYDSIVAAGAKFSMALAGHYCLDACRVEKGFKHWGHDMSGEDSPLEVGLSFAIDKQKQTDFIGRAAVQAKRQKVLKRHLLLFSVDGHCPLLLHDEPIYRDGEIVGLTTSGSRGFRTDLSLCFAMVKVREGESRKDLLNAKYEIGIAGERFPITPLHRPPYDPDGRRMRA